ncbi:CRISPR type III-associated RAMP protein Csm3 [bacterium HR11]|nr:CRISPR type III-associated RAMP protein Csm3 [bacterium HR11]
MENRQELTLRFQGKYVLTGRLRLVTGLHIGGREAEYEIGGQENAVVKDPLTGEPYIPGSSLKGKIRSLLEWAYQSQWNLIRLRRNRDRWESEVQDTDGNGALTDLSIVFGPWDVERKAEHPVGPTRVIFRDAFLTEESRQELERVIGGSLTEVKAENAIDRVISRANPRTMERVPAGAQFDIEILFDVYEDADHRRLRYVLQGLRLLEDSALGGGGSRGSGRVRFEGLSLEWRGRDYYTDGKDPVTLAQDKTVRELLRDFDNLIARTAATSAA